MEAIRKKLKESHDIEDLYNKEMGKIDKEILKLRKRKVKLSKLVSKNMRHRNYLINRLK